jgi:hypothetical protein
MSTTVSASCSPGLSTFSTPFFSTMNIRPSGAQATAVGRSSPSTMIWLSKSGFSNVICACAAGAELRASASTKRGSSLRMGLMRGCLPE